MRPGTAFSGNIVATSLVTGRPDPEPVAESTVVVFANPFTDRVTFFFTPGKTVGGKNTILSLFSVDGKLLMEKEIAADQRKWEWVAEKNVASGFILYNLVDQGRITASGKLVKQ